MWPRIVSVLDAQAAHGYEGGLILEGSGVWPDLVAELPDVGRAAIWLTASPQTLRTRICAASGYADLSGANRALVDKFIGRTELYDTYLVAAVGRLGLPLIDVDSLPSLDALADHCLLSLAQLVTDGGR
jgi:hypothetical protein